CDFAPSRFKIAFTTHQSALSQQLISWVSTAKLAADLFNAKMQGREDAMKSNATKAQTSKPFASLRLCAFAFQNRIRHSSAGTFSTVYFIGPTANMLQTSSTQRRGGAKSQ
ncbi:MAG: hypothetical protein AAGG44_10995, partial [Planctomycetota bacterium]